MLRAASIRNGVRALIGKPSLSLVIVLTLALGIGANTAVFSVVNAVLIQPLPYRDADQLVWLWSTDAANPSAKWVSYPDFIDLRAETRGLADLTAWYGYEMVATGAFEPERVQTLVVFGDLFGVLGVPPALGTTFRAERSRPERSVVLSHQYWQRRFNSDADVVGRSLALSDSAFTVVGVMPPQFQFPIQAPAVDLWITLGEAQFGNDPRAGRGARLLEAIGRLRPAVDLEDARAELAVVASRLSEEYPDTNKGIGAGIVPAAEHIVGRVSQPLWMLFAAVGFVLLIACLNVANLLLARSADRRQEIALRGALGASRSHIVGELAVESLMLAIAGGALGSLLALWGVELLLALVPGDLPRVSEIGVDGRVLGFAMVASLITGLAFGLAPAWHASKVELTTSFQSSGRARSDTPQGQRLRGALVIGEIAIAMILLTGAALFITTFWRLSQPAMGFDARNVLTFEVTWPWETYSFARAGDAFRELQGRLQAIPGVRGAAAGLQLPDRGGAATDAAFPYLEIEGRPVEVPSQRPRTRAVSAQPGYFQTLGIPLREGRDFDARDDGAAPPVVIVNESLARLFFPGVSPIGKRLKLDLWLLFGNETPMREIVGVAADVTHRGLDANARPLVYLPLSQRPFNMSHVVVRTDGDPAAFVGAIRDAVRAVDKNQPLYDVQTLEQRVGTTLAQERFNALLLTLFSSLAIGLAAIGLYAVLAHNVARRTPELGLRLALGSDPARVRRLVVAHGLKLVVPGLVLGLGGALALSQLVTGLLFGITPTNPLVLTAVTVVLALVAGLACWLPARRAARVDPVVSLRYE